MIIYFDHQLCLLFSIIYGNQGPELQCLLKVKQDLSKVLIFQHAILNAKLIAWIDVVFVVKDIIVIFRKIKTILILISFKR